MFEVSPELKACYELKESFRELFNQKLGYQTAEERLLDWLAKVEATHFKALNSFVKTLRHWWPQILNYFDGRYTNGFAERVNLKKNQNAQSPWIWLSKFQHPSFARFGRL